MAYRIQTTRKSGNEPFIGLPQTLLDYWQWAHSDIAGNSERGKLAEFLVRCAVNSATPHRVEWDAVDIISPEGIRIEVKSSAYLQTWNCETFSNIIFDIAPKLSWDSETNAYYDCIGRNSDVYVFCLFACQDPTVANPLNTDQWEFYVLSTHVLNNKKPKQKTIGIGPLKKLGAKLVSYAELGDTIRDAYYLDNK